MWDARKLGTNMYNYCLQLTSAASLSSLPNWQLQRSSQIEQAVAQPAVWRFLAIPRHVHFVHRARSTQTTWHLSELPACSASGCERVRPSRFPEFSGIAATTGAPALQVDGEPWLQPAAQIEVDFRGTALMLRRLESAPLARMAAGVTEALEACQAKGLITPAQRHALTTELAARLHPIL